jgi:hypothetical protein
MPGSDGYKWFSNSKLMDTQGTMNVSYNTSMIRGVQAVRDLISPIETEIYEKCSICGKVKSTKGKEVKGATRFYNQANEIHILDAKYYHGY